MRGSARVFFAVLKLSQKPPAQMVRVTACGSSLSSQLAAFFFRIRRCRAFPAQLWNLRQQDTSLFVVTAFGGDALVGRSKLLDSFGGVRAGFPPVVLHVRACFRSACSQRAFRRFLGSGLPRVRIFAA